MPPARPGLTDLDPHSRYDQTTPDLYASARAGARMLAAPRPITQDEDPRQRESAGRPSARRRRQWGSDRRTQAAADGARAGQRRPDRDGPAGHHRHGVGVARLHWSPGSSATSSTRATTSAVARTEEVLYLLIVTLLTASAMAYLLSRLGFFYRTRTPPPGQPRPASTSSSTRAAPTLTTIIPSYQEEERVIRTTLLSAALQEYPRQAGRAADRRPVRAQERSEARRAAAGRPGRCRGKIERLLAEPARRFAGERCERSRRRCRRGAPGRAAAMLALASALRRDAVGLAGEPGRRAGDRRPHRRLLRRRDRARGWRTRSARSPRRAARQSADEGAMLGRRRSCAACTGAWSGRSASEVTSFERKQLRVAVARAQQGDEPQQLHRA